MSQVSEICAFTVLFPSPSRPIPFRLALPPHASASHLIVPFTPPFPHYVGLTRTSRSAIAGEFELVPSMPGVIALDDAPTAELDEPWEHISADELDTEPRRPTPPSYAAVAASAA